MIEGRIVFDVNPYERLKNVRAGLRNRAIRTAISKACAGVKQAVISAAPEQYGFLKKSIRIKIQSYQDKTVWVGIIGAKSDYIRFKGKRTRGKDKGEKIKYRPANYLRLVDQGTKHIRARNFMTQALSASIAQYQSTLAQAIEEQLAKYMQG